MTSVAPSRGAAAAGIAVAPLWARAYLAYERETPNHAGKRTLLRLLLRAVNALRPQPFAWRMENGALLAIAPPEGLAFAWTVGWTCFQTGRWETHVERCIRRLLRAGDRAIDVGANLGYFTAVMAQCVGEMGEVWSFEPTPPTFERLRLSVALNGYEQVTPLALALGDAEGREEIAFEPRFTGSASFHGDASANASESHLTLVRRLDDLLARGEVGRPRLIKIDVEGHELAVVRGALETIATVLPAIIFEYSEQLARRAGWTLPELVGSIASCGDYRFFEIRDHGLREIAEPADFNLAGGDYGADVLALPSGDRDREVTIPGFRAGEEA